MPIGASTASTSVALLRFGPLDPPLDLADVVEILVDARAIARAEAALQRARLARRSNRGCCGPRAMRAARCASVPPSPNIRSNTDARVDLHRQRRRRRRPGDRVHVGAAVAGRAGADVAGEVLGRELERRERRVLADLLRDDLIDRRADADVLAFGPLRDRRRSASPTALTACIADLAARRRVRLLTTTSESLNGSSGFRIGVNSKPRAGRRRRPLIHDRAVRDVDDAEARARRAPASAPAPSAPAPSRRAAAAPRVAPMPRRNVRRGNDILVMNMSATPSASS